MFYSMVSHYLIESLATQISVASSALGSRGCGTAGAGGCLGQLQQRPAVKLPAASWQLGGLRQLRRQL